MLEKPTRLMNKALATFTALLMSFSASAVTHTLDISAGNGSPSEMPVRITVGDVLELALPDGVAFSLDVVSAPPAGIAGQSFIARDKHSEVAAIIKPTTNGLRIAIDDFTHARTFTVRIENGVAHCSVRDTIDSTADSCATCGEVLPLPEPTPTTGDLAPKATTAKLRLAMAVV